MIRLPGQSLAGIVSRDHSAGDCIHGEMQADGSVKVTLLLQTYCFQRLILISGY